MCMLVRGEVGQRHEEGVWEERGRRKRRKAEERDDASVCETRKHKGERDDSRIVPDGVMSKSESSSGPFVVTAERESSQVS